MGSSHSNQQSLFHGRPHCNHRPAEQQQARRPRAPTGPPQAYPPAQEVAQPKERESNGPRPPNLYVTVSKPGRTECAGCYQYYSVDGKGRPMWFSGNMRIYTDAGGYWMIGASSDMSKGVGWFATQSPHNGKLPHSSSLEWAYVVDGASSGWVDGAPLNITTGEQHRQHQQQHRARPPAPSANETPSEKAKRLFSLFDTHKQGSISSDTFAKGMAREGVAHEMGHTDHTALFPVVTCGAKRMTQAHLEWFFGVQQTFLLIDQRKTGRLSAWDLETALRQYPQLQKKLGVSPHLAQSLIRQMDSSGTGMVSLLDFARYCDQARQHRPRENQQDVVSRLISRLPPDTRKVTLSDLEHILRADRVDQLELGWPASQAPVMFRLVDRNGTGWVTLSEFRRFLQIGTLFNRIDSTRDGYIAAWEFGNALSKDPSLQKELGVPLAKAQSHFRAIDTGNQGNISFAEFYLYFRDLRPETSAPAVSVAQPAKPEEAYVPLKKLGEGTYGVVHLVRRKSDGLELIMKQPKMLRGFDMEDVKREAELLRRVKHPNIIRFVEAFRDSQGAIIIITEFADGGDLRAQIRRTGRLSEDKTMRWFGETCEAVKYLHSRNILHRDLKPDNIFLTSGGMVKVGDLGLAKQLQSGPRPVTHTVFKGPSGQPTYMAPEQIYGMEHSMAIDIWALGCILYEMATGKFAFNNSHAAAEALIPRDAPAFCSSIMTRILHRDQRTRPTIIDVLGMLAEAGQYEQDDSLMASYIADRRRRR